MKIPLPWLWITQQQIPWSKLYSSNARNNSTPQGRLAFSVQARMANKTVITEQYGELKLAFVKRKDTSLYVDLNYISWGKTTASYLIWMFI